MNRVFQGYSNETFEFFMAIRFNNNRPFFLENRDWYLRAVREPSLKLAEELAETIESIDSDIERRPHRALSRINRDIRFSRDKSPYRDNVWLSFKRPCEEKSAMPGFYFDLQDGGASYGMGFYRDNRGIMENLRRRILEHPEEMQALMAPLWADYAVYAEPNRRLKVPEEAPEALRPIYLGKGFYLEREIADFDLICSAALAEVVREGYLRLAPLYRYILDLRPDPED